MNHNTIKEKLFEFLEQELSEIERKEISLHLESCKDCKNDLKLWKSTQKILTRIPEQKESEVFTNKVMHFIFALTNKPSIIHKFMTFRWLTPALGTAIAVLFVCFTLISAEPTITTENLLLAGLPDENLNWIFSSAENIDVDNLLIEKTEEDL